VLLLLERREIVNRDSASYFALMMLALTCCLAGGPIHFGTARRAHPEM
jgi:hypothetical protein